jgi:hypothetical protein
VNFVECATGLILQKKAPVYAACVCQILSNKCNSLYFISIFAVHFEHIPIESGHVVAQLVEALRYKLEGHGFDSR